MRLKVTVQRHGLPPTNLLWTTEGIKPNAASTGSNTTVSQLLEQINEVIPLEATEWGLEDYVVEVQGFECLHFSILDQILKEDDTVVIKALKSTDQKLRKISGRLQISSDGRHLVDGVPFGRPFLRTTNRPPVRIPPRKRARLTYEQDEDDGSDSQALITNQLVLHRSEDTECSDESSEDLEYEGLEDELEDELQYLVEDIGVSMEPLGTDETRATRSKKRRRGQGLGIEGSGMSGLLTNDDTHFTDPNQIALVQARISDDSPEYLSPTARRRHGVKGRKEGINGQLQERIRKDASRGSSRSSTKSARFDGAELETPATIRMDNLSQDSEESVDEDLNPFSDSRSDSSGADKENVEPLIKAIKLAPPLDEDTSSSGTSSANSNLDSDSSSSSEPDSDTDPDSESTSGSDSSSDESSDTKSDGGESTSSEGSPLDESSKSSTKSSIDHAPQALLATKTKRTKGSAKRAVENPDIIPSKSTALDRVEKLPKATNEKPMELTESKSKPTASAPGQGNAQTRSRARRRAAKRLRERLESQGAVSEDANKTDLPVNERIQQSTTKEDDLDIADLLEKKRQALLKDVAQTETNVETNTKPPYEVAEAPSVDKSVFQPAIQEPQASGDPKSLAIRTADDLSPTKLTHTSETPKPRARLDLQSSRRMLFGSLGLRAPKTSADEEKLRNKLMENVRKPTNQPVAHIPERSIDHEIIDDSWKEAIDLKAVECCYDGMELSTPPFPFMQRWDPQQKGFSNKRNGDRTNKRKRNHGEYYEDSQEVVENSFDSTNLSGGLESTNPPEPQSLAHQSLQVGTINSSAPEYDLPTLPTDISSYPLLTNETALPGAIIAFKQMHCSEETRWQPTISNYQTGVIDGILDDKGLIVKLGHRNQSPGTKKFDPTTGQRLYTKFEMPGADDYDSSGILELAFTDLIDPKLTKPALGTSKKARDAKFPVSNPEPNERVDDLSQKSAAEDSVVKRATPQVDMSLNLLETQDDDIPTESSLQEPTTEESIALSSAVNSANEPAVSTSSPRVEIIEDVAISSSQVPQSVSETTRQEISVFLKDAGFRSSVASELRDALTMELPAINSPTQPIAFDHDGSRSPADDLAQLASDSHDPPDQMSSPIVLVTDPIDQSLGGETIVPSNVDGSPEIDDWAPVESINNDPLYPRISSQVDHEASDNNSGPETFQDAWEDTKGRDDESESDFKPAKKRRSSRLSSTQGSKPLRSKGRGLRSKSTGIFSSDAEPSSSPPAPARATRSKTSRMSKSFGSPFVKSSPHMSPTLPPLGDTRKMSLSPMRLHSVQVPTTDASDSLIEPSLLFKSPLKVPSPRHSRSQPGSQSQPPQGSKTIDLTGLSSDPVIPEDIPAPEKKPTKVKKARRSRPF